MCFLIKKKNTSRYNITNLENQDIRTTFSQKKKNRTTYRCAIDYFLPYIFRFLYILSLSHNKCHTKPFHKCKRNYK